jgi:hypothetical protein
MKKILAIVLLAASPVLADNSVKILKVETLMVDKYILFSTPTTVSENPQIQSLVVFGLPAGFSASIWNSSDLAGTAGNEFDWDIAWGHQFDGFRLDTGIGAWDFDPVLDKIDAITAYAKVSTEVFGGTLYFKPRFYHTDADFLGNGWHVKVGFDRSLMIGSLNLSLNPFVTFNDGFGRESGVYLGTDVRIGKRFGEHTDVFLTGRAIKSLTEGDDFVHSMGVGVSYAF